jgi:hypothetical protein
MSANAKPRIEQAFEDDPQPDGEIDTAFDEWSLEDIGLRADLADLRPVWAAAYD